MVYAEFGGQTECIMGNWKIENSRFFLATLNLLFMNLGQDREKESKN